MDIEPTSPSNGQLDYTVSTAIERAADDDATDNKISAYYSLAFPGVTYYMQTLSVSIGRRSVRQGAASTSESSQVDIDLGPLKNVSRLHARIEWEDNDDRFVLAVLGRNGAWVDGIWSGSGSRVPLNARSQIQIATRIFHFVLPLPPPPEDSPSPSSPSTTRHATPSIDVTSLSPPSSLPSPVSQPAPLPADPPPKEKPPQKANGKKRKKRESEPEPPPAVMPARPIFTYTQLSYQAIKAMNGKATLQEVCSWVCDHFEWFRYNKACGWESSIRHNLSGNKTFKKLERCAGERGKGFFWSVDPQYESSLEEQKLDEKFSEFWKEQNVTFPDDQKSKGEAVKTDGAGSSLEDPSKKAVKTELKAPLPPPFLTSSPLPAFASVAPASASDEAVPAAAAKPKVPPIPDSIQTASETVPEPGPSAIKVEAESTSQSTITTIPPAVQPVSPPLAPTVVTSLDSSAPSVPPHKTFSIIVGPTASSTESSGASPSGTSADDPPIALKGDTIVLNPAIFSYLTPEQLKELEALDVRKAIEILNSYTVSFVKLKAVGSKGKGKKKNKSAKRAEGSGDKSGSTRKPKAAPATAPFTTAPLSMRKAQDTPANTADQPAASDVSEHPTRTASPMISGLQAAVAPLRISSPPVTQTVATGPSEEIIDIMGDSSEEPAAKKRRVEESDGIVVS